MKSKNIFKFFAASFGLMTFVDLYCGNYFMVAADLVLMSANIYFVKWKGGAE